MFSEYSILSSNLKLIFGTLLIFIFLARFDLIMPESLSRILLSILLSDLLIDLPITVKKTVAMPISSETLTAVILIFFSLGSLT